MKPHKLLICVIILFISQTILSQKQNDNWFFGKYVGINFNPLYVGGYGFITGSQMEAPAGSAVMSDPITGQLLFYTDGKTIWNKAHTIMSNGSGLRGSPSSAQPAIIVPKPGSNKIFYVFTMSGITDYQGQPQRKGLAYSIIDMSLNSGLGGVTTKNIILFSNSDTEMLTSTLGHDGSYYWVVTQKESNFMAYKVSASGVNTTPVISPAVYSAIGNSAKKGLKISPDSSHLAVVYDVSAISHIYTYSFNNLSGEIQQGTLLFMSDESDTHQIKNALEFSQNSGFLYVVVYEDDLCECAASIIYKFRLNSSLGWDFVDSGVVHFEPLYPDTPLETRDNGINSLQLAPNGKIMISGTSGKHLNRNYLAYIDNPDDFFNISSPHDLNPSIRKMHKGFPQLVYINTLPLCEEDLYITNPITNDIAYQVSKRINASSIVYQNLTVDFRAREILLLPGFSVSAYDRGIFNAIIDPCSSGGRTEKENQSSDEFINKESKIQPTLSPNPTSTFLYIDNIEEIYEWKVMDINGKIVDSGRVNNSVQTKITINTSRLISGIYYFNAVMKDGELFQKIVIKK